MSIERDALPTPKPWAHTAAAAGSPAPAATAAVVSPVPSPSAPASASPVSAFPSRKFPFPTFTATGDYYHLMGLLSSVNEGAPRPGDRVVVFVPGMLARKEGSAYTRLAEELLQRCGQGASAPLQHVFRFDCSGVGESGGVFTYGGYKQLVQDAGSAVRFLQDKLELEVIAVMGHSMGASTAALYGGAMKQNKGETETPSSSASSSSSFPPPPPFVPYLVALAPRFDMMVDPRFDKNFFMQLLRDGSFPWQASSSNTIPITLETYQERVQTDVSAAATTTGQNKSVSCLVIHGDKDTTIPLLDSATLHRTWIKPWTSSESELEEAVKVCTCALTSQQVAQLVEPDAKPLTLDCFNSPMKSSLPHTFVPLPDTDHGFSSKPSLEAMVQTVALWINAHANPKA